MREDLKKASPLLRLVALNGALGAAIGLLSAGVLVGADVHGLGTLIQGSRDWGLALALLGAALAATGAGASIATAVMLLPEDDGPGGPGRRRLAPVRAGARIRPRRA